MTESTYLERSVCADEPDLVDGTLRISGKFGGKRRALYRLGEDVSQVCSLVHQLTLCLLKRDSYLLVGISGAKDC